MKEFPDILNVSNKSNFEVICYDRNLCYLRRELYEHIIRYDEDNYFDIEKFCSNFHIKKLEIESMIQKAITELTSIGWKCKLSYGGTALFIYSDKIPKNCWDDGLI